jgi:hypothetical protein
MINNLLAEVRFIGNKKSERSVYADFSSAGRMPGRGEFFSLNNKVYIVNQVIIRACEQGFKLPEGVPSFVLVATEQS